MGSGDLPGLQSRRFGPYRAEWWIRLPHASAKPLSYEDLAVEGDSNSPPDAPIRCERRSEAARSESPIDMRVMGKCYVRNAVPHHSRHKVDWRPAALRSK
jgi:hypothetical protein